MSYVCAFDLWIAKNVREEMESPPVWSENLVRNFERLIEWCDAVALMCDLTPTEYEHYKLKEAWRIEYQDAQDVIISLSANFGSMLSWIGSGVKSINENPRLPKMCLVNDVDLNAHSVLWKQHVNETRQVLDTLKREVLSLKSELKGKLQLFHEEESDEYSSYSDYSEETESTDEEEEEEDEEENSRERNRRRRKDISREKSGERYEKNYDDTRKTREEEPDGKEKKREKRR
jgi:hypothetical protein